MIAKIIKFKFQLLTDLAEGNILTILELKAEMDIKLTSMECR